MAWEISVGDARHRVEVREVKGRFHVTIDGEEHAVDASFPEAGLVVLRRGDRRDQVDLVATAGGYEATIGGRRYDLSVLSDRARALRGMGGAGAAGGRQIISTSMPGKVVTVLVAVGDSVEKGQGIVVVEAMKMENELKASGPGIVEAVEVVEGQAVEGGVTLVVISAPKEG